MWNYKRDLISEESADKTFLEIKQFQLENESQYMERKYGIGKIIICFREKLTRPPKIELLFIDLGNKLFYFFMFHFLYKAKHTNQQL